MILTLPTLQLNGYLEIEKTNIFGVPVPAPLFWPPIIPNRPTLDHTENKESPTN